MGYPLEELYADVAQVWHSSAGLFGSGRLIGRNLVLTARHVVTPEKSALPAKDGWQVCLKAQPDQGCLWIKGTVVWYGQGNLDLALIELQPEKGAVSIPKLKLRIGRIDQVQQHVVRGLGFPRGAKVDNKRVLFVPSGKLDDSGQDTLIFGIDQQYQPESPNEDWRGFSGSAVVLEDSTDSESVWIYGAAQQVPQNFTRQLDVARLAKAWEDPGFGAILRGAGASLEPPEDPVISAQFPQPELRAGEPESPNLFYYASRRIPYCGRKAEMQLLDGFLTSPTQFAWYLITGGGGTGKSRLALELCLKNRDRWLAGFANKWVIKDIGFWRAWRPLRPTLLVFDEVAAYAEDLGELARFLRSKQHLSYPVRLLLLERDTKKWLDEFNGGRIADREEILMSQYPGRREPPLQLGPLSESDTLQIMLSVASPEQSAGMRSDQMLSRLRRIDSAARPLFAAFLAAIYSKTLDEPTAVMREILKDEEGRWEEAGATGEDKRLLALATICGGIPNPASVIGPSGLDAFKKGFSALRYQAIVGKPAAKVLAALEPDILGELFVLDWLGGLEEEDVTWLVDTAWQLNQQGCQAFILRAVPDFPEHQALPSLVRAPQLPPALLPFWSSALVTLLLNIPGKHLALGTRLYDLVKTVALQHPHESPLYEDMVRGAINLLAAFAFNGQWEQAQHQYGEAKELIDKHPDKERAAEGQGRLLVYSTEVCTKQNEAELARPLPPAPLTFLRPMARLHTARDTYNELIALCRLHPENTILRRLQAQAATDLIMGFCAIPHASRRIRNPLALLQLTPEIVKQFNVSENIYEGLEAMLSKGLRVAELDAFLARSASAIIAADVIFPDLGKQPPLEKMESFYNKIENLTVAHPEDAGMREELARAAFNLVLTTKRAGRLSDARHYYLKLCDLARNYPKEAVLEEKKNRAEKLLPE
jgi:hypothetical protein